MVSSPRPIYELNSLRDGVIVEEVLGPPPSFSSFRAVRSGSLNTHPARSKYSCVSFLAHEEDDISQEP